MNPQTSGLTNTSAKAKPADPKQQAQFDLLLGRSRQLMEQNADEWLSTLKAAPVEGAVTLGTTTLRQMAMMSEKAGQQVDPAVLIHVGVQLVKDVAAVANAAGLVSDKDLAQYLKDVMSQSMMQYMQDDAKDGLLSPAEKQRAQGMLSGMQTEGAPAQPAQPAPPAAPVPEGMLAQMQGGA